MAYANNFQTIVTGLRFKCFVWTSDLFKMGVFCDFNIYEKEPQNLIDFEIVVKNPNGGIIDKARHHNISVNQQTIHMVGYLVNFFWKIMVVMFVPMPLSSSANKK